MHVLLDRVRRAGALRLSGPWLCLLLLAAPLARANEGGSWSTWPTGHREDFSGARTLEWRAEPVSAWQLANGVYQARTRGDIAASSLYAERDWGPVALSVTYTRAPNAQGSGGLLVCASPDFAAWSKGSGYLFSIGSDGVNGLFSVFRQDNGAVTYLRYWAADKAIQPGTNQMTVVASEGNLSFYINQALVWSGRDERLDRGRVGLLASTSEGQQADHVFDDVLVQAPPEAPPPPPVAPPSRGEPAPDVPIMGADTSPLLRPGLQVRISVLVSGKREIDAVLSRVTDSQQLDLPLIGSVPVQNMTLGELTEALQARYEEYFVKPQILADFAMDDSPDSISPWGSVVVLGRVRTPGRVNIPPTQDLTVSAAIQKVGGLDTSAKSSAIRVTRRKPDGGVEVFTVDFSSIGRRGKAESDLLLKPGDLIFVPESIF